MGTDKSLEEIVQKCYDVDNERLKIKIAGLTVTNDGTTTTLATTSGDYFRIGDAGTTSHVLASEDDLLVTGRFEVKGITWFDAAVRINADTALGFGTTSGSYPDCFLNYESADANAHIFLTWIHMTLANNVPVFAFGDNSIENVDLGLFDGVTQPAIAVIEKNAKYAAVANATSTGAAAILTTATAGTFTNAAVGDIVRVTAGTNATAGWYFIVTATDEYNITLDRNWCSGAVTGGTIVCYHHVGAISAEGVNLKIKNGADFGAGDFELSGMGAWMGFRADTGELQIVPPSGTMVKIALA